VPTELSGGEKIKLANELMGIIEACRYIDMHMGDFAVASIKTYCPFGEVLHEDGGRSKSFRVYPATNSAYCFACVKPYRPVSLIATDRDIPEFAAADLILEEKGYVPPDYEARWEAVTEQKQVTDADALGDALRLACSRMVPNWDDRQFEEGIATILRKCVAAAHKVTTDAEAREWLNTTKIVMKRALEAPRKETV
jgi:hypothetical protein